MDRKIEETSRNPRLWLRENQVLMAGQCYWKRLLQFLSAIFSRAGQIHVRRFIEDQIWCNSNKLVESYRKRRSQKLFERWGGGTKASSLAWTSFTKQKRWVRRWWLSTSRLYGITSYPSHLQRVTCANQEASGPLRAHSELSSFLIST